MSKKVEAAVWHRSEHVPEEGLLSAQDGCPFCGSLHRSIVVKLQEEPEVVLLHCKLCHAASASRMPTPATLEIYYSGYYDSGFEDEQRVTIDDSNRFASHIIKYSATALVGRPRPSILDFGGGDGSVALHIADMILERGAVGCDLALVDIDQTLAPQQHGNGLSVSRPKDLDEIPALSVDLVIASAVIEHLPEARAVLTSLLGKVAVGGIFYARTPYVSPFARILKSRFDFTYPGHVHDLGAKFWNGILTVLPVEGSFEIVRSSPSLVETSFDQHFARTLAAYALKVPGYVFSESYGFVGGWEIFIKRTS